mgnify:CR=1 FL=1
MARKTLLTEAELRNFMKLAELRPLSDAKISEMYGNPPGLRDDEDREDEDDAGKSLEEDDMAMDDAEDDMDDAAMDMGDAEMDMGDAEMDMGDDAMDMGDDAMDMDGGAKMVAIDDFMSALESALEDVLGEPVSTEMDDDMGDDMDADDEAPAMDIDMTDDVGMDMDADDEDDMPGMRDYMEEGNSEELVNEVARRVAKRLQALNDKQSTVDNIAEKIMQRLTQ